MPKALRQRLLLVATLALVGCAAPSEPSRSARPVLLDSEDETSPRGGVTCRVASRARLAEATLARPDLTPTSEGLAVIRVVREGPSRRVLRVVALNPRLEPLGQPIDVDPEGEMPLWPRIAECGRRLTVAWQLRDRTGSSVRLALVGDSEPSLLVTAQGERPAVACDGDVGAVAWASVDRGLRDVLLRSYSSRDGLGPARRVSGRTTKATRPALACRGPRCAVVWSDRRAVYAEIWAALVSLDGEASRVVRVSSHDQTVTAAGGAYAPSVAPLDDGGYLVAWHDSRSRDEAEVYASSLSENGSAGADRRLSRSIASSTDAAVASCGGETTLVAWRDLRRGPPVVMAASVDRRGRRHSAALVVSEAADETSAPSAICSGDDAFVLAWTASNAEHEGEVRLARVECR